MNLYAYVQGDPINAIDPMGLFKYKAFCRYISGGDLIGGGVLKCRIEGPCTRDNKKTIWMTETILSGFTAGTPGGLNYFSTVFDDRGSSGSKPDIGVFMGGSHLYGVGWARLGKGRSHADIKLGSAHSVGWGDQTGLDASIDLFWGETHMNQNIPVNTWQEDCCYGQDE